MDPGVSDEKQDALFGPTEYLGAYATDAAEEYEQLPTPIRDDELIPTLVFSIDSPEEREDLARILGVQIERSQGQWSRNEAQMWSCWWPAPPDDGSLRLEL